MDLKKLLKGLKPSGKESAICISCYAIFGGSLLYMLFTKTFGAFGLAVLVAAVTYAVTLNCSGALILGAVAGLFMNYMSRSYEGFESKKENTEEKKPMTEEDCKKHKKKWNASKKMCEGFTTEEGDEEEEAVALPEEFEDEDEEEGTPEEFEEEEEGEEEGVEEPFMNEGEDDEEDMTIEGFATVAGQKKRSMKRRKAPDHGSRAEMFKLGKKYKIPSESDDSEFHLDAGTTFMNAYKSLKPDQIASMTKDTQELMQTQKQLMSTLATLKPLITDGKEMMDMFTGYFGKDGAMPGN
jgi:hypothetical protein